MFDLLVRYFAYFYQRLYFSLLVEHREHGNRIMHEFLLGQKIIASEAKQPKTNEYVIQNKKKYIFHSKKYSFKI